MNKAKFFEEMKECRVNASAHITISPRSGGKTALVMNQSGAPNAFLSSHKDGSDAMRKAWDKYEAWLKEYFMSLDETIELDQAEAVEEDREVSAMLVEADELEEVSEPEQNDPIEIIHGQALVMNAEIDVLSQRLADRRCYWLSEQAIRNAQVKIITQYKRDAFNDGPRVIQHILKVIVISRRLALNKTGLCEIEPKPGRLVELNDCEIPF